MNPSTFSGKSMFAALKRVCLVLGIMGACTLSAQAESSNRNEVRANVAAGGWEVIWGVTINEAEYLKAAGSIYAGNPGAYFSHYLDRNIAKVASKAPGIGKQALKSAVMRALQGRQAVRVGDIGVKAGIVSYRRWKKVSYHVPKGTERYKQKLPFGGWTWGWRPKMELVEKRIPLPNHHQPYVAFRLYKPGPRLLGQQHLDVGSNGNSNGMSNAQYEYQRQLQEQKLREERERRLREERRRQAYLQAMQQMNQLQQQQNQVYYDTMQNSIDKVNQAFQELQLQNQN